MKVIFTEDEISEKLILLLKQEGLSIIDNQINWSRDEQDGAQVTMKVEAATPTEHRLEQQVKELQVTVEALEAIVRELQDAVESHSPEAQVVERSPVKREEAGSTPARGAKLSDKKKPGRPVTKAQKPMTPQEKKLQEINAQIEAEADLVANPLGSSFKVVKERHLGSNEALDPADLK